MRDESVFCLCGTGTGIARVFEQADHFAHGQVALCQHPVLNRSVGQGHGVFQVHIFQVRADILIRLLHRLSEKAHRVVDVPQRADIGSVDLIEQGAQFFRIGIDAVRLHEQRHAMGGRHGREPLHPVEHKAFVYGRAGSGRAVGEQA